MAHETADKAVVAVGYDSTRIATSPPNPLDLRREGVEAPTACHQLEGHGHLTSCEVPEEDHGVVESLKHGPSPALIHHCRPSGLQPQSLTILNVADDQCYPMRVAPHPVPVSGAQAIREDWMKNEIG